MNERIAQLIEQATETRFSGNGNDTGRRELNPQKLVELVLQDVLLFLDDEDPDYARFLIHKNYGIK